MAAKKTNTRKKAVRTQRGQTSKKRANKVEVIEKRPKNGFEPVGNLAQHEVRIINLLRRQTGAGAQGRIKPIDRIAQLERGETEVFAQYTLHGVGKTLRQLERDSGKTFNYQEAVFSPGIGLPAQKVLWVQRKQ